MFRSEQTGTWGRRSRSHGRILLTLVRFDDSAEVDISQILPLVTAGYEKRKIRVPVVREPLRVPVLGKVSRAVDPYAFNPQPPSDRNVRVLCMVLTVPVADGSGMSMGGWANDRG